MINFVGSGGTPETEGVHSIVKAANALFELPFFHFSQGSKELFHSNVWYSLAQESPKDVFRLFFGDDPPEDLKTERESNRFDLKMTSDEVRSIYIVENKVKKLVDNSQLESYALKVNRKDYGRVMKVVSLVAPLDELPAPWGHMSYEDLATRFNNFPRSQDAARRVYVEGYQALLDGLVDFGKAVDGQRCYGVVEASREDKKRLDALKLYALYSMLQCDRVSQLLVKHAEPLLRNLGKEVVYKYDENKTADLFVNTDFSPRSKGGLSEAVLHFETTNRLFGIRESNVIREGIQLQGKYLHYFFESKDADTLEKIIRNSDFFIASAAQTPATGMIGKRGARGPGDMFSYAMGNHRATVFRYLKEQLELPIAFPDLVQVLWNAIDHAIKHKDALKHVIDNYKGI